MSDIFIFSPNFNKEEKSCFHSDQSSNAFGGLKSIFLSPATSSVNFYTNRL